LRDKGKDEIFRREKIFIYIWGIRKEGRRTREREREKGQQK
jgi:hypothetical protein